MHEGPRRLIAGKFDAWHPAPREFPVDHLTNKNAGLFITDKIVNG
jgi:hypothetical protein